MSTKAKEILGCILTIITVTFPIGIIGSLLYVSVQSHNQFVLAKRYTIIDHGTGITYTNIHYDGEGRWFTSNNKHIIFGGGKTVIQE